MQNLQVKIMMLFSLCYGINAMPTPPMETDGNVSLDDLIVAEVYLKNFYTFRNNSRNTHAERIKEMQKFFGLKVTGKLDINTVKIMKAPRCGIPDILEIKSSSGTAKWDKTSLTYKILNFTPDLPSTVVTEIIKRALDVWSQVTPLVFTQVQDGDADIVVQFARLYHNDQSPFDGPGGVLAHAFLPKTGLEGNVHFDEDETWTYSSAAVNLFLVAAHEFGHSLGLAHSKVRSALMYPIYTYVNTQNYRLPKDDVTRIQALYGKRTA